MQLSTGSPLTFTPDPGWEAILTNDQESWPVPVIGWAAVVRYVDDNGGDTETEIEPVVLVEDRYPVLLQHHLRDDLTPGVRARLRRIPALR